MGNIEENEGLQVRGFSHLREIRGFYVLTDKGMLAVVDANGGLVVDTLVSEAFYQYSKQFLQRHEEAVAESPHVLGILYPYTGKSKWQSPTFLYTDHVVRSLYKTGGHQIDELTDFQHRQKGNSIYRGMELLLDHKVDSAPGSYVYCPLLYDNGKNVGDCLDDKAIDDYGLEKGMPILEVINFLEYIEPKKRNSKAIRYLNDHIYSGGIDKTLRKPVELGLVGEFRPSAPSNIDDTATIKDDLLDTHRLVSFAYQSGGQRQQLTVGMSSDLLSDFVLFKDMGETELEAYAAAAVLERAPKGFQLFSLKSTDDNEYFLLTGCVCQENEKGILRMIEAETASAANAISNNIGDNVITRATTDIRFFHIDQRRLKLPDEYRKPDNKGQSERQFLERIAGNPLFAEIYRTIMDDKVQLPSYSVVSTRIRATLQQGSWDQEQLVKILQLDPAITAKIIRQANNPHNRGPKPAGSLNEAISQMGLSVVKKMAIEFSKEGSLQIESTTLQHRLQTLWHLSTEVAEISFVLGSITPQFLPDRAQLAGLLHHIGEIPVLHHVQKHPDIVDNPEKLNLTIHELRQPVGELLLRHWGFPEDIVNAVAECEDWYRDPVPAADLCDLVLMAKLHYYMRDPTRGDRPALNAVPAFSKLALGRLSPTLSLEILQAAHDRIEAVDRLLAE